MPFKLKCIYFFLGILWTTTLPPGTSANPALDQSEKIPYVIYSMVENIRNKGAKEDIKCSPSGTEEVVTPENTEKKNATGLTCIGHDNVTVPLLNKKCTDTPSKLTITVNKDEDVVIGFKDDMATVSKEMFWQKPLDREKDPEKIRRNEEEKLIVPVDKSRESGFYSLRKDDGRSKALNSLCAVAVIRRECSANRYGEDCSGWCPDCMYGGVCHDKTGKCVCPPGRKGDNCEEACEGKEILNNCSIASPVRKNAQICLPSPYGCSCPPGYEGYSCNEGCDNNHWGVNCLQTCNHCYSNECNPKTGTCNGQAKPCAGGTRGYYRFRQEPEVKVSPEGIEISFVHAFEGDEPDAEEESRSYKVVVWQKGKHMNITAFETDLPFDKKTFVTVPIKGYLEPTTDYFAAVLVVFTLKESNDNCTIDGTLRGERIQKTPFTAPCPKGERVTPIYKNEDITQDSFSVRWHEEKHAGKCNYTYDIEVKSSDLPNEEPINERKYIANIYSVTNLKSDTTYKVTITVVSKEGNSKPATLRVKTLPKLPVTPTPTFEVKSHSVTFQWKTPSDAEGNILYRYRYKVESLACDKGDGNWTGYIQTEDTWATIAKPFPYAMLTFQLVIKNEAGPGRVEETSFETDSKAPEIKVKRINCEEKDPPSFCNVFLEDNCTKINGKGLKISPMLSYETMTWRNQKTGTQKLEFFSGEEERYHFKVNLPKELLNHTKYTVTVSIENEFGTNENPGYNSMTFITPPVAPGKVTIIGNVTSAHSSLEVSWSPPPTFPPTGDIEKYVVRVYNGNSLTRTIPTTNEFLIIDGLDTDVTYTIKITGRNKNVSNEGKATVIEGKTEDQKPSPPMKVMDNSNLTEIEVTWRDHEADENFPLFYEITFGNSVDNTTEKTFELTGLEPEMTYLLKMRSCNQWKCSDVHLQNVSTQPPVPEVDGPPKVVNEGNYSKINLPHVKNPPAHQYVVVVKDNGAYDDTTIKDKSIEVVKEYIKLKEQGNKEKEKSEFKRSTADEEEPDMWVAADIGITNETKADSVNVGTGIDGDRPLEEDKDYKLLVVTEKKSGNHVQFTVSDPVNAKGQAAAAGVAGILFGVLIFLALIALFAWSYKKKQTRVVVRTPPEQDRDLFLPAERQKRSSLRRQSSRRQSNRHSRALPADPNEENIYSNLSRRVPFANIEAYLLKAVHSPETDMEFNSVDKDLGKTCSHAEHSENRLKNRYKNNLPYNETRVRLPRLPQMPFTDYINASYIEGHLHPKAYIATQGPKDFNKDTTHDFWRMVWHTKSQMIVMIANLVENGKEKVAQYWPSEGTVTKGDLEVTLVSTELRMDYIIRKFTVTNQKEVRKVRQYQFTTWPDHGIPENPYGVGQLISSITGEPVIGPIIVHCSAGIGRTGTILLVLGVLDQINNSGYMDVHEVLVRLREGRPRLVENTAQYKFAHSVLQEVLFGELTRFSCRVFPEALAELRAPKAQDNMSIIQEQFHRLKKLPKDMTFKFGQRPQVSHLNRDPNILPPDSRLVFLDIIDGREESQYINAVSIKSVNGQVIAAEHPQTQTLAKMWRMVFEKSVSVWTLLQSFLPGDSEYPSILPNENVGKFGKLTVEINDCQDYDNFTEYQVTITHANPNYPPHKCMVVLMKSWPHTETQPPSLLPLLAVMERSDSLINSSSAALFTCKDGVTACGVMIALKVAIDKVNLHQEVDVYHSVQSITFDRPEFIISEEQYDLVHEGVSLYLSAYSTYGNFN